MKALKGPFQSSDRASLIKALKQAAKMGNKAQSQKGLSELQDLIAVTFGYGNWSMLHKNLASMTDAQFEALKLKMVLHSKLGPFLQTIPSVFDAKAARLEMRDWVRGRYTPLIDFAYYDKESSNGFAWPDVDLHDELRDQFDGTFPEDLIASVAGELEENGPWGIEMQPEDADQL